MSDKQLYVVVMAGGRGERFWPQSRADRPKQLLRLLGNLTLIEQSVERLRALVPPENCLVITNEEYVPAMRSLLRELPPENIIGEPMGRDTGPCVALGAGVIRARTQGDANAVMMVLPADHAIRDVDAFHQVLSDSVAMAREKACMTVIGVTPTFPATGYGYIQCADAVPATTVSRFRQGVRFCEKPGVNLAEEFLAGGDYKWNSGIFIWPLAVIDQALRQYAPALWTLSAEVQSAAENGVLTEKLPELFAQVPRISIDYAVMEHIRHMLVAECSFDWDDVGSWTALRNQMRPHAGSNIVRGLFSGVGVENCIVVGESDHLIAAIDVADLIIVETDDVTLVCSVRSAQRVKEMVQLLGKDAKLRKFV